MKEALKIRIRSALIFGVVILGSLILSDISAKVLLAIIMLCTSFEYLKNMYVDSAEVFSMLFSGMLLGLLALGYATRQSDHDSIQTLYICLTVAYISINMLLLLIYKPVLISLYPGFLQVVFYIFIPFTVVFLEYDNIEATRWVILAIILIIWMSDVAAYFVGSRFGKRKLFPSVSPNKTWEGFLGAGLCCILLSIVISLILTQYSMQNWMIMAVIIWLTGSLGDLIQSSWKRRLHIKDSGSIMPGHGGYLDRFDSLLIALPVIVIYLKFYFVTW